ncbi:Uncharacterised protein [Mycobacteroides abscessus subsp. abscessus]|nr:Uncharacterised protein [Mycobacteroides abscessus subsp. abscessus]
MAISTDRQFPDPQARYRTHRIVRGRPAVVVVLSPGVDCHRPGDCRDLDPVGPPPCQLPPAVGLVVGIRQIRPGVVDDHLRDGQGDSHADGVHDTSRPAASIGRGHKPIQYAVGFHGRLGALFDGHRAGRASGRAAAVMESDLGAGRVGLRLCHGTGIPAQHDLRRSGEAGVRRTVPDRGGYHHAVVAKPGARSFQPRDTTGATMVATRHGPSLAAEDRHRLEVRPCGSVDGAMRLSEYADLLDV